jgi:hypothetical protein
VPDFYPGCRVVLRLRIDEGADTAPLLAALQRDNAARTKAAADAQSNDAAAASAAPQGADPAASRRAITAAKLSQASLKGKVPKDQIDAENAAIEAQRQAIDVGRLGLPLALTSGVDKARTVDVELRPHSCSITRTNVLDACKATVAFSFHSLPIDPRLVRSCGITIMMGEVTESEFAEGIEGARQAGTGPANSRPYSSELPRSFGLIRFEGFVDTWDVSFDEDTDEVSLEARDLSSVLRDTRLPDGFGIDLNLPLVDGVKGLLEQFPGVSGIPVVFAPAQALTEEEISVILTTPTFGEGDGPVPADVITPLKPKVGKKGKPGKPKALRKGEKNEPIWDHILSTCMRCGVMPSMRGRILFLQTAQAQAKAGEPWLVFYGRDLLKLELSRKLEGINQQTVEVRVPDPMIGRTRWARYPVLQGEATSGILGVSDPVVSRASKVTPAGTPEERVLTFEFDKVTDSKTLEGMAKQIFEQLGRQEIRGSFETRLLRLQKLKRRGVGRIATERHSALDIWPGDSALVLTAPAAEVASLLQSSVTVVEQSYKELTLASYGKRIENFTALGFKRETAEALAKAQELVNLTSKFQVHGVQFDFSKDEGITVKVDFQNFVAIRDEQSQSAIEEAQNETDVGGAVQAQSRASARFGAA